MVIPVGSIAIIIAMRSIKPASRKWPDDGAEYYCLHHYVMGGFIFLTLITAITPSREYGENMASITLSAAELLLHRLQALDVAYIFYQLGH